jgi:hypothetical protein
MPLSRHAHGRPVGLADGSLLDQPLDHLVVWVLHLAWRGHHDHPLGLRCLHDVIGLRQGGRHRLLDLQVLASVNGLHGLLMVHEDWRGDDHRINGAFDHLVVVLERELGPELLR